MALLAIDSFDFYATADLSKRGWNLVGTVSITTSNARRGNALSTQFGSGATARRVVSTSGVSTIYAGFAFYVASSTSVSMGGTGCGIFSLVEGTTQHLTIGVDSSQRVGVMRGGSTGTVLGSSAIGVVPVAVSSYIEIGATIHDTTGTVTIKVNGTSVLTLTGQDTRNGLTGVIQSVQFGSNNVACYFDDLYVCDSSGSAPNNTFLGDVRVDAVFPDGDGNYTEWTPSTGTTHYTLVDETTPNTSDYNSSGTSGQRDTYAFAALPSVVGTPTVYGVAVNAACLKDDAGAVNNWRAMVRSSSTDANGATSFAPSTSQEIQQTIFETDPNGSIAWTQTSVNAAEFGVNIT